MSSPDKTNKPGNPAKPAAANRSDAKPSNSQRNKPAGVSSHNQANKAADVPAKPSASGAKVESVVNQTVVTEDNRLLSEPDNNLTNTFLDHSAANLKPKPEQASQLVTSQAADPKTQPQQYLSETMQQLKRVVQHDNQQLLARIATR